MFKPRQNLQLRQYLYGVEKSVARAALYSFYALVSFSIIGAVLLRRRRARLVPLLAIPALVLITVAVTYGDTRFRTPAEVVLAVLGAVTIDAIATWLAATRAGRERRGSEGRTTADSETVVPTTSPCILALG